MSNRSEYMKEYRRKNREKRKAYARKKYKQDRKKRLTYAKSHYILNREVILVKVKEKSLAFRGHAYSIYTAICKWAKKWKLPFCTFKEFYDDWTFNDPTYEALWDAWKASNWDENLSPVVMRLVKKNGFVAENLKWDIKNNYSWWNEDSRVYKEVEKDLNDTQKTYNKSNKEWQKKVRDEWKAKQKAKRGERK